jgi:hypothetical protein
VGEMILLSVKSKWSYYLVETITFFSLLLLLLLLMLVLL